mgnify:CR=1 FL=1
MLDLAPELRVNVIECLCSPKHAKTATKLVIDYGLDIANFPNLQKIVDKNSSSYFIRRVFKDPSSSDHMPLTKVEDLLKGQARMLGFLVEEVCKHAQKFTLASPDGSEGERVWLNSAKGVWDRNNLSEFSPGLISPSLKEKMEKGK